MTLSQSITVLPRRSYTVELWTKQTKEGNCKCSVKWAGEQKLKFMPGKEYGRRSVMFPVGNEDMVEEVAIELMCESGGEGGEVFVDDVSVEVAWTG